MERDIIIFLIGVLAAFFGAIVGGGGLVSIPLLTLLGFPTQVAIATNKLGGIGLCFGGISKYWKEKKIDWKLAITLTIIGLPATYFGTLLLINIDKALLQRIVGIIILLVAPLIIFQKSIQGKIKAERSKKHTIFGHVIYFVISVYSGFFGGGTGVFARLIYIFFYKKEIIEAGATDLVPGLFSNILAVTIMAYVGYVNFMAAIVLLLGMVVGGYLGAHTAVKKGDEWVRVLFVLFILVTGLKLLFF